MNLRGIYIFYLFFNKSFYFISFSPIEFKHFQTKSNNPYPSAAPYDKNSFDKTLETRRLKMQIKLIFSQTWKFESNQNSKKPIVRTLCSFFHTLSKSSKKAEEGGGGGKVSILWNYLVKIIGF